MSGRNNSEDKNWRRDHADSGSASQRLAKNESRHTRRIVGTDILRPMDVADIFPVSVGTLNAWRTT